MSDDELENPGLKRLIRPNRAAPERSGPADAIVWMSLLPRVAESQFGFVAGIERFERDETDLDTLLADWNEGALNLLLDGGLHQRGVVQLDAQLVAGLTEAQTTGKITSAELPERPTTQLDATLCDHVIEAWLQGVAQEQGQASTKWTPGRFIPDARSAKVLLGDGEYTVTRIRIVMGEAARVGELKLIQPMAASAGASATRPLSAGDSRRALLDVDTSLTAVLHTTKVPYTWLRDLKPDDLLEVPRTAIHSVRIEAGGKCVAMGHLGRAGDNRAVRILDNDAVPPVPPRSMQEGVLGGVDVSGGGMVDGGELALPGDMAEPITMGDGLPELPPLE